MAEIVAIATFIASDDADGLAAYDPDPDRLGEILTSAYEDIALADAVRRSSLASGGRGTAAPNSNARERLDAAVGPQSAGLGATPLSVFDVLGTVPSAVHEAAELRHP